MALTKFTPEEIDYPFTFVKSIRLKINRIIDTFNAIVKVIKTPNSTNHLTTINQAGTFTADYDIQAMTNVSPFGFASANEAETAISVIRNLQLRVKELEDKLESINV